jgi:hypothetical protein
VLLLWSVVWYLASLACLAWSILSVVSSQSDELWTVGVASLLWWIARFPLFLGLMCLLLCSFLFSVWSLVDVSWSNLTCSSDLACQRDLGSLVLSVESGLLYLACQICLQRHDVMVGLCGGAIFSWLSWSQLVL